MSDLGERIARELSVRTITVLVVLGVLALVTFLGITRLVFDAEAGAAVVNLAGRQRMLVERTALATLRLTRPAPAESDRLMLSESLEQLDAAHAALLAGLPTIKTHRAPSRTLKALYFGPDAHLDRDLRAFVAQARTLLSRPLPLEADDPELEFVQAAADGPLLAALDQVAIRHQQENESTVRTVLGVHGGMLALSLAVLLVAAFAVFRPMILRIRADIEERFRAEKDLRESEERLWRMLEESPVGVSVSRRADGRIIFANKRFTDILGMTREEFIGSPARDHFVDDAQRRKVVDELKRAGSIDGAEVEFRKKDGSPFWSLLTLRSIRLEGQKVNLAWIYDITDRKAAEEKIKLAAKVLETVSEGVTITNSRNEIIFVNPAFSTITEYGRDEVMGGNPSLLSSGRHDRDFYRNVWNSLQRDGRWRGEVWNRRKSGEFFAEWLSITVLRDTAGAVTHYVGVFSDITHRKEDEERVWRQANYDALTGLPNRALFVDRLSQAVRQSRRDGSRFALMFLDLDGFKAVNDTLGHAAGDILLQQTAQRLCDCMRASDTVARLAGDEFTIILQGVRERGDASHIAAKVLAALAQPFDLEGRTASVQGSIGIALFPDNAQDGPTLLRVADEVMYSVKKQGKNDFRFVES